MPRPIMHSIIAFAMLLVPAVSFALLPPEIYRQAAKKAQFHAQVKVLTVTLPRKTPGRCMVKGRVVRLFRAKTRALVKGGMISFAVHCRRKGDRVAPGPVVWKSVRLLGKAKYLEVALDKTSSGFEVARYNSSIIAKPSAKPQYGFPFHR